ncbi:MULTISPECIES: IS5 family transposase [Loigolactobacillus]|uniref:IS5 family transposase n=2 Tax=Loigolactobacillus TaxID=2767889 RepID=A0A5B8TJM5_9LACO|nr:MULTISPECIES: IS5 family transposase [Loigolactobacillus]RRG00336.1 MAG: IS5 family transposase [Lactobacillus sp.]QEA52524.1 IS5 family transposase [Loigolactobacillus coryniformis]QEA53299.1 IS5 family transposase [Loigolactobacillus coryniformis]QEA53396.1 IS5 family transposase [Loigolactobacillus coryniformis]QEA53445.1 IS5 family transposase [Loigolactobacillus coryniformis]
MYKPQLNTQLAFEDFDQPMGLSMNPENRWIKKAAIIPWSELEKDYTKNFRNRKGNVAKPLRMALGALLIQTEYGYSDEETVLQIQENPYLQFFIGLPGYQNQAPFDASTMVYFRKRLDAVTLATINEKIIAANSKPTKTVTDKQDDHSDDDHNSGTLILDATCAPQNIKYPTDTELLNDARTHLEKIIDVACADNGWTKPRIYRRKARQVYLAIVRRKRKGQKWLRKQIRRLLNYVKRDLDKVEIYLTAGYQLTLEQENWLTTSKAIYAQQKYMYTERTHSVKDRIVSFSQPWIRPILRGKARTNTEFGVKLDVSLDRGFARIEKTSFDAYNESTDLVNAVRRYYDRNGHYPARVLADKIYRNRGNLAYCKERDIRLSGPALGRPKKNETRDKRISYQDNADRIAVERDFSLMKRRFSLNLIMTKLPTTTLTSVGISVIALNLSKLMANFSRPIFGWLVFINQIFCKNRQKLVNI